MTDEEISTRADAWIRYYLAPKKSKDEQENSWAIDTWDLEHDDPEAVWLLILAILHKDSSIWVKAVLSAGLVENLLDLFGPDFIDRIEIAARRDPKFAHMLGGCGQAVCRKISGTDFSASVKEKAGTKTPFHHLSLSLAAIRKAAEKTADKL